MALQGERARAGKRGGAVRGREHSGGALKLRAHRFISEPLLIWFLYAHLTRYAIWKRSAAQRQAPDEMQGKQNKPTRPKEKPEDMRCA